MQAIAAPVRLLAVLLFATLWGAAAAAEPVAVDLELVLAVDVSRSIDEDEYALQKRGYAEAFVNPAVLNAILANPNRRIAVTMVEWAGADFQRVVVPWTLVSDEESGRLLSDAIQRAPRAFWGWTSISGAIDASVPLFEGSGFTASRRVIDVSGDGVNNSGRPAALARDDALKAGITINGLVIMNDRPNPGFRLQPQEPLDEFYRDNVIGGPGAFLVSIEDFESFAYAIVNKLVKEIAALPTGPDLSIAELRPR